MSIVICQCGSAARSVAATDVMRLVSPAWSPLPSPSKSKFTPSSDLACSSGMRAADKRGRRRGDDVSASSELWAKSVRVSTTRSPTAWARRDQVGEVLALEAVPPGAALVECAVGVHVDGEVGQRRQPGDAERARLRQRPVRGEGEVLASGQRRLVGQRGRRRRRRCRWPAPAAGMRSRPARAGRHCPGCRPGRARPARGAPAAACGGATAEPPSPTAKPAHSTAKQKEKAPMTLGDVEGSRARATRARSSPPHPRQDPPSS